MLSGALPILATLIFLWILTVSLVFAVYQKRIISTWNEPAFRHPIFILESDDWGPGEQCHASRLDTLRRLLLAFRDVDGRPPVMTLGLILSAPDKDRIKEASGVAYHRVTLEDPRYSEIRRAIMQGIDCGIFSPQLHGMEHFWPPSLLASAKRDESVAEWLDAAPDAPTEQLPDALQSRWIDASHNPPAAIASPLIRKAISEEVQLFAQMFKVDFLVVVPPTFVWNDCVEGAWRESGVDVIVTPGTRFETRDENGHLAARSGEIHNGQSGHDGVLYVVRDEYFEPIRGHTAENTARALREKSLLGRPCLVETHRKNYIADEPASTGSYEELRRLLTSVCTAVPEVRFMSTAELATRMKAKDPTLMHNSFGARCRFFLRRLHLHRRLRVLTNLTGITLIVRLIAQLECLRANNRSTSPCGGS